MSYSGTENLKMKGCIRKIFKTDVYVCVCVLCMNRRETGGQTVDTFHDSCIRRQMLRESVYQKCPNFLYIYDSSVFIDTILTIFNV